MALKELESLEVLVIVDNEVDPISQYPQDGITAYGGLASLARDSIPVNRGGQTVHELRMEQICCGAHGLSLMIVSPISEYFIDLSPVIYLFFDLFAGTAIKGDKRKTLLFDAGPEEAVWELNAKRLRPDLSSIDVIHLSHWHRDHSGGMLRAVEMINAAKASKGLKNVTVDLHPDRPDYRGVTLPDFQMSLEADPTFAEITNAGGIISENADTHTILDDMFLISGEIPRVTNYETGLSRGARLVSDTGKWEEDTLILDERFVIYRGIVVFTGCSHAGVVNVSKHALALGEGAPLYAIMGGYHLGDAQQEQIDESVCDLMALEPKLLIPGHCTGWRAKYAIEQAMGGKLVPSTVGTRFTL
ncbi:hypothetical protein FKW77_001226 [Venturia effusa]|uniref:Metallo-beta-lactamase domain-containing protein n=1 Tax=Venturia effusa TaxID=50376 RepID=A0A517LD63_9PEZI|nr:hypothetical protein FKW77_001226 [Venturia effusa]